MQLDVMTEPATWGAVQDLARTVEAAGFDGIVFTEMRQPPWISVVAAHHAAPSLQLSTGIAVAFPRSPMVTAQTAWELAEVTDGRFRLGLGSQVRGAIEKRYASPFEPPVGRMHDYVAAVKDCWAAFRGDSALHHDGPHYRLTHLPPITRPRRHAHEDLRVDIAAVGPAMVRVAGEVADGIHVHPLHSVHYLRQRLLPALAEGVAKAGRQIDDVDLMIPVMVAAGDTEEERAPMVQRCRMQLAFYGSTRNYAFQFDDLGFDGTTAKLADAFKSGDVAAGASVINQKMLDQFTVTCMWKELPDRLAERYGKLASRLILYTAAEDLRDPDRREQWARTTRALHEM